MPLRVTLRELVGAAGRELGSSEWLDVTQERIDAFADATDDHQWIHVDLERSRDSAFGGTIAHGYLTLSLIPTLLAQLLEIADAQMGVNYGIDRLRFTSPVPSGSRVRLSARLGAVERRDGRVRYTVDLSLEIEGEDRPALIGEMIYLAA